jgi:hypothetical protein
MVQVMHAKFLVSILKPAKIMEAIPKCAYGTWWENRSVTAPPRLAGWNTRNGALAILGGLK